MSDSKKLYRVGCFVAAAMVALVALTTYNTMETSRYRRQLELTYMHSLQELSTQMNAITVDLQKAEYAGTPAQVSAISAKVWRSAGAAKVAMAGLPARELELDGAYQFLSQVGDYSMYLTRKSLRDEEITAEERENFQKLTSYAADLNQQIANISYLLSSGEMELAAMMGGKQKYAAIEEDNALSQDMEIMVNAQAEGQPDSYPALIYDGPFSDHLLQHNPELTRGKTQVSLEKAKQIAAQYSGIPENNLSISQEEESHMPSHTFTDGTTTIGVTKAGGYVTFLVSGREIGSRQIAVDTGREITRAWLEQQGIGSMRESYFELANGVLSVNYAFTAGDVVCYTDLIKVGVAMDTGDIVFYDARGYIGNHKDRVLESPSITVAKALESLSPSLTPKSVQLALIPTAGQYEILTYEFRCKGQKNEDVLVYVNVHNGAEEQILILLENENGALAI